MKRPKIINDVRKLPIRDARTLARIQAVAERYPFLSNDYYLSLVDWDDPDDPIRRIVVPHPEEFFGAGDMDPSREKDYTVAPGLQHKYRQTALLLVTSACAGLCRYCFRKRLFLKEGGKRPRYTLSSLPRAARYLREHEEITSVLITGGDPLTLPTKTLDRILSALDGIPHIRTIRIGSKVPAYNPFRILRDPELPELVRRYSRKDRRLYVITHFLHPRELTPPALEALDLLSSAGALLANQTPLIRGVNDHPDVLEELFRALAAAGDPPYYVFQCRPTRGNAIYAVPIEEGIRIFYTAQGRCTGLASRVRYVMSHAKGKLEILGKHQGRVLFRYHRAANPAHQGRIISYPSNPDAYWLEDFIHPRDADSSERRRHGLGAG